jgi:hypothetical protein
VKVLQDKKVKFSAGNGDSQNRHQVTLFVVLEEEEVRELLSALKARVMQLVTVRVDHGHVAPERRVVELLLADLGPMF